MKKILLFLILLIFCGNIFAQNGNFPADRPTFVVVIAIDGLQADHLATLWNNFEGNGFKKAVNSGFFAQNGLFSYVAGSTVADYASIITGSTPNIHGIISDKIYSVLDDDFVSIVLDEKFNGIGTNAGRSPKNLSIATIGDALKLYNSNSKVFSIGLTPEAAITLGGHCANGVVWLDSEGLLASTDFYKIMPAWANKMNMSGIMSNYLQAKWRPMSAIHTYKNAPFFLTPDNCFYSPESKKQTTAQLMENFRRIPSANSLIKDLAVKAIRDERLGLTSNTDMLCLNFSLMPVNQDFAELNSAEKEDMYLNLDRDLKELFIVIDQNAGLENTVIVITGTQTEKYSPKTLTKNGFPTGKFDGKRAMALLNSFLMAKYGQGRWVLSFNSHQILINQPLIEKNRINKTEMINEAVAFLKTLQGVENAFSAEQIFSHSGCSNDIISRLYNSFYPKFSGDISIVLKTGWQETNIDGEPAQITSVAPDYAPIIIFGSNIPAQKSQQIFNIVDIAPTVCGLLRVPFFSTGTAGLMNNN
ncbi:MAG: alkaline phosphatase family protein [Prevotellaceae bacterium]|jgi:hypothetical protein|nr:alkaline phosphatase family protein [Prevotellaceae bacterium]